MSHEISSKIYQTKGSKSNVLKKLLDFEPLKVYTFSKTFCTLRMESTFPNYENGKLKLKKNLIIDKHCNSYYKKLSN